MSGRRREPVDPDRLAFLRTLREQLTDERLDARLRLTDINRELQAVDRAIAKAEAAELVDEPLAPATSS